MVRKRNRSRGFFYIAVLSDMLPIFRNNHKPLQLTELSILKTTENRLNNMQTKVVAGSVTYVITPYCNHQIIKKNSYAPLYSWKNLLIFVSALVNGMFNPIFFFLKCFYRLHFHDSVSAARGCRTDFHHSCLLCCMLSPFLFNVYLNELIQMCFDCPGVYIDELHRNVNMLLHLPT